MDEERRLNIAGGLASAVLFIPPQGYSISDADLQASINSFQNFKLRVPVQRRIINSNCGSDWQHRSYTSAQFSEAIDPSTVNIYRLHANYFFSSTSGKIKVK
ncbi:unnamed protein product [Timema podura]|uniref:Uncharacterized protein n=1 Tax=Timema podura TaxID=61482 RepID=A0ABN7P8C1_TIMPD|nr:unnamed protein product [Timema podura]